MIRIEVNNGDIFGYWTIIKEIENKPYRMCECKCRCGNIKNIHLSTLRSKKSSSCGCYKIEKNNKNIDYKQFGIKFDSTYRGIVSRCEDKNSIGYDRYGKRGIKCLWLTFEDFKEDMYNSYLEHIKIYGTKETTIDRINSKGNYCKENCRWATIQEQVNNRKNTLFYEGVPLSEYCKKNNLNYNISYYNLKRNKNI